MLRRLGLFLANFVLVAGLSGCSASEARNAAMSLATTSGKLNDTIQTMTRSWAQIETARDYIITDRIESGLETNNRVQSRLAVWRALSVKGNEYETRVLTFD